MKTKEVKIRLTDQDHAKLTKAAQKLGQPLAIYLLSAALEKCDQASRPNLEERIAALEKLRVDNLGMARDITTKDSSTATKTTFRAKTQQYMVEQGYITRTELQERLASTQPTQKAKMIPASLMKTSVEQLVNYTKERDPDGTSWQPTNKERTLWAKV